MISKSELNAAVKADNLPMGLFNESGISLTQTADESFFAFADTENGYVRFYCRGAILSAEETQDADFLLSALTLSSPASATPLIHLGFDRNSNILWLCMSRSDRELMTGEDLKNAFLNFCTESRNLKQTLQQMREERITRNASSAGYDRETLIQNNTEKTGSAQSETAAKTDMNDLPELMRAGTVIWG